MKLELAKGVKDIEPREQIMRERVITVLKRVFAKYGYNPLDTPVLERLSLFESKYGGGAEILKEVFKVQDQGGRELGLRFDLTVPFARFVGMNPTIKMPFKRYQIGLVFRDGPIKLGRYREFYQCDCDLVGSKDMIADAEILFLAREVFENLGLGINLYVNNRKILDGIMEYLKIPENNRSAVILAIDKLEKIGQSGVEKELFEIGLSMDKSDELFNLVNLSGNNKEKIAFLRAYLGNNVGLLELEEVLDYAPFAIFDPRLARGLNYYTGTVYEVFLKGEEIKSSLAAGGRFDSMISNFLEREEEYPSVGISFGLDVICDAMRILQKITDSSTLVEVYVIPINTKKESFILANNLRDSGLNVDIDLVGRGVSKNLDFADKYKIPFVVLVGNKELEDGKYKLKDMQSGKEESLTIEQIIKRVKNARV